MFSKYLSFTINVKSEGPAPACHNSTMHYPQIDDVHYPFALAFTINNTLSIISSPSLSWESLADY
jgi:hypothetical protein